MPDSSRISGINGVDLEYLEEGAGVPVVFSHGGSSDLRYWEPQRKAFSERFRFVAYSRRFHGLSTPPPGSDNSTEAHVADLIEIIRRLPSGPVHLVGFSTSLALRVALSEPELLASMTIIEPNVPWLLEDDPEGRASLAWWRAENQRVEAETRGDVKRAARLWFELVNNRGPGTFETQAEGLRQMWLDNFRRQPAAPPPDPLTREQLRAIAVPTLAIGAESGMTYSQQIVKVLSECIPGCRQVLVPGVTHFMSYQDPSRFNQVVLDFLSGRRPD